MAPARRPPVTRALLRWPSRTQSSRQRSWDHVREASLRRRPGSAGAGPARRVRHEPVQSQRVLTVEGSPQPGIRTVLNHPPQTPTYLRAQTLPEPT